MEIPDALRRAASTRHLIPFVGAGVSMGVRGTDGKPAFPSWKALLEKAAERLRGEKKRGDADRLELEVHGLCRQERDGRLVPASQLYARYFGEAG